MKRFDTIFDTITKEELIEALEDLPDGARVAFASDYGDRCNTQQLHSIEGQIEEKPIHQTAYSDSGYAVDEEETEAPTETVYVIS